MIARSQATVLVALGAISYGFLATITKLGYAAGFHAPELIGSQMLLGVIVLWLLAVWKGQNVRQLTLKAALSLIAVGSFSGITGMLYYISVRTIPASIAIIMLFQFVWVGLLYDWIFGRKKPTVGSLLLVFAALAGAYLASGTVYGGWSKLSLLGVLAGLGAAFSYAGTLYASGKAAVHINPWYRSALMGTGAWVIVWLVFPPTYFTPQLWLNAHWWIPVTLGLLGLIVPILCFAFGAPRIGIQMTTMLCSIELPIAVLMARIVFLERVDGLQWLGVALIMAGLIFKFVWFSRSSGGSHDVRDKDVKWGKSTKKYQAHKKEWKAGENLE
ncbi:DMT family transporter [Paenibacillus algorifonticola]|uniref:EamA family transporter n=1 Tax=Paenibacillus algorifonticola TaxID=684063 RepID=UPI003D2CCAD6